MGSRRPARTYRCPAGHKHGATLTCYRTHGCGCEPCTTKNRLNGQAERKRAAYGRSTPPVDATATRERVHELAKTMSLRGIARAVGMSQCTIQRINDGTTNRVEQKTVERIFAITSPHLLPATLIDATGTKRRLHALASIGWSHRLVAVEAGLDPFYAHKILSKPMCRTSTVAAIAEAYERLSQTKPPTETTAQRSQVAKTRAYAKRNGWPAPDAWWDVDMDDPKAEPDLLVEPDEPGWMVAELDHMYRLGESPIQAAQTLDRSIDALRKRAHAHGRHDIAAWLTTDERLVAA